MLSIPFIPVLNIIGFLKEHIFSSKSECIKPEFEIIIYPKFGLQLSIKLGYQQMIELDLPRINSADFSGLFYSLGLKINVSNDYKFDAIRFSFKPFSIHQSLSYIPENLDYLIWTDADLRCKKNFESADIIPFLPDENELMSYLGRKHVYSECGFLGFNLNHPEFKDFIDRIINIYTSGELFSLQEWHDSWIWDHVRKEFENKDILFKNISGRGFEHHHPFINSGLEKFFDHLKGPTRKKTGESPKQDYIN